MKHFILIPRLKIHNANAMSSPYTIGFPAITAWMGAVHALQRYLHQQGLTQVNFKKIAISCDKFDLQTYKGSGDFVHSIIGTSNPLDEKGRRPAFVEEARCHLMLSLLIEYDRLDRNDDKNLEFKKLITAQLPRMKWAGGDLLNVEPVEVETIAVDENDEESVRSTIRKLMPGHVIVERRDLIINGMKEGQDALDALIDHLKVMHRAEQDDNGNVTWASIRKTPGWLVPIAVGFQGISPLGKVKNQRNINMSHRFAESVVTLGEFVMPYRIKKLDDMLWQYHVDLEKNLYLCRIKPKNVN